MLDIFNGIPFFIRWLFVGIFVGPIMVISPFIPGNIKFSGHALTQSEIWETGLGYAIVALGIYFFILSVSLLLRLHFSRILIVFFGPIWLSFAKFSSSINSTTSLDTLIVPSVLWLVGMGYYLFFNATVISYFSIQARKACPARNSPPSVKSPATRSIPSKCFRVSCRTGATSVSWNVKPPPYGRCWRNCPSSPTVPAGVTPSVTAIWKSRARTLNALPGRCWGTFRPDAHLRKCAGHFFCFYPIIGKTPGRTS